MSDLKLTPRGRTWAALAAVVALGAVVSGATLAASAEPRSSSLEATAEAFVEAVNRADWPAVAAFVAPACQGEALNRANANAALLLGTHAELVSADEATGVTVTEVTYPTTGQLAEPNATTWRFEGGRWTAPLDGCDAPPKSGGILSAQGAKNAAEAMARLS